LFKFTSEKTKKQKKQSLTQEKVKKQKSCSRL